MAVRFTSKDVRGSSTKGGRFWKEYKTWQRVLSKCYNPNHHRYSSYGAKGLAVDDLFRYSFLNFLNEIGECPEPKPEYSIERIDNSLGYLAGNVAWLKIPLQALNKTNNKIVKYKGKELPLSVLCKDLNLNYETVNTRLGRGYSLEDAISQGRLKSKSRFVVYNSKKMRLRGLVTLLNLNYDKAMRLFNQGYTGDEIAANPIAYMVANPVLYSYNDKSMTVSDWARYLKVSRTTIVTKLNKGLSIGFICDMYLNRPLDE